MTNKPHPQYGITPEQVVNLDKLATYLENLPEDYQHFEMRDYIRYREHWNKDVVNYLLKNGGLYENCGTVGCALGHGPASGVLATVGKEVNKDHNGALCVDWEAYARNFVPGPDPYEGRSFTRLWRFLFGPDWHETDNTAKGAAARIRFILAGRTFYPYFRDSFSSDREEAFEQYQQFIK